MCRFLPMILLVLCLVGNAKTDDLPSWWDSAASKAQEDGYFAADHSTLKELMLLEPHVLILDTRSDYEFETGHIPGALNLEFDLGDKARIAPEKKKAFLDMLGTDKDRPVVVYCRSFR